MIRRRAYSGDGLKRLVCDEQLLTPEFIAKAQAASIGLVAAQRQSALSPPPSLRTPTCPTLVIWGAQDQLQSVDYGKQVAAEINGAKFIVIPRAGHLPQVEQPSAFLQIAQPFLLGASNLTGRLPPHIFIRQLIILQSFHVFIRGKMSCQSSRKGEV